VRATQRQVSGLRSQANALKAVKKKVEGEESKLKAEVHELTEYWFSVAFHKEVLSFTVSAQRCACLLLMLRER
jgi:hypothetical protein